MISSFSDQLEAKPHTPVYLMHKYFARRPWNVFNELISHYTAPSDIVLDPFCGGGVTVVESLKSDRKAIGVDVNPLATYVTEMECRPLNIEVFQQAFSHVSQKVQSRILGLYRTKCARCSSDAVADWIEWDEAKDRITRLKYDCPKCDSSSQGNPLGGDTRLADEIRENFAHYVRQDTLWYPETRIPPGDKTNSLLVKDIRFFHELFTKRNLLALSLLLKEINLIEDKDAKEFLQFAFSSSLKWASRQSHIRGKVVEGWAMHAYWIYPKSLEINVWNTFRRRATAVLRGKTYSNQHLGKVSKIADGFDDLVNSGASYLVLNKNSAKLPIPDNSVGAIITDPPYGGNVNYAELADYWFVWMTHGKIIEKDDEVIINRTQGKGLDQYELLLGGVLNECYRVLKPERYLVSTFNSKDIRIVASFIIAASRAGFTFHPDGLLYQNPIRAYTTTFHAMQIGAFVGDFIFTFVKEKTTRLQATKGKQSLSQLKAALAESIVNSVNRGVTEPQLREQAYRLVIPFLAENASTDPLACSEARDFFEAKMAEHEQHFRQIRKKVTSKRRRRFRRRP